MFLLLVVYSFSLLAIASMSIGHLVTLRCSDTTYYNLTIVTIKSVKSFAGQRCLTQLWVCILAGGPFVATFITTFNDFDF